MHNNTSCRVIGIFLLTAVNNMSVVESTVIFHYFLNYIKFYNLSREIFHQSNIAFELELFTYKTGNKLKHNDVITLKDKIRK